MERRSLGVYFEPSDYELLQFLRDYDRGQTRDSFGKINQDIDPYGRRPEQLQNVSEDGSYYYHAYRPGRNRSGQNRKTADGSGYWDARGKQRDVGDGHGRIVAEVRKFKFESGTLKNSRPTKWAMEELTLVPGTGHVAAKAICKIYKTKGTQKNERGQASNSDATNPSPIPGLEPSMGSSSHTNVPDILRKTAAHLGVDYELTPRFNMD